jgi:hypothetical protein
MFAFAKHNVYINNLNKAIPGDSEHFIDPIHFADRGYSVMAGRVFNALFCDDLVQTVIKRRQLIQ